LARLHRKFCIQVGCEIRFTPQETPSVNI
jgi:hypothetical protein